MKITILGSGPCLAIPRKGCRCAACRDARKPGSKTKRTRSSVLVSKKGFNLLIDCSPDFLEQAAREKIKTVDAVILTHAHADAAGGLKRLSRWSKKPISIYTERTNIKRFKHLKNLHFKEIILGRVKPIGPSRVSAFRVKHGLTAGFPTVGYAIDKNFGYISDVGEIPKNNKKYFQNIDLLFLDGALWFGRKMKGHLSAGEAIALARELGAKKTVLTQIGHGYPPYGQASRRIKRESGGKVYLGYDGMSLTA